MEVPDSVTTTRYPGNPDFHETPPRCFDCGQFCGGFDSSNPAIWERINPYDDMPDLHRSRCLDCATDRVQDRFDIEDRTQARHEVLAAISGGPDAFDDTPPRRIDTRGHHDRLGSLVARDARPRTSLPPGSGRCSHPGNRPHFAVRRQPGVLQHPGRLPRALVGG